MAVKASTDDVEVSIQCGSLRRGLQGLFVVYEIPITPSQVHHWSGLLSFVVARLAVSTRRPCFTYSTSSRGQPVTFVVDITSVAVNGIKFVLTVVECVAVQGPPHPTDPPPRVTSRCRTARQRARCR